MDSSHTGMERRRSQRVVESRPVIVRGVDLLGQPFEERSSTININLQGCCYASKYHLPRNSWVTLEIARGAERDNVRARVAWLERPRSIHELFQVAVELESPGNFWAVENPPEDWTSEHATEPESSTASLIPQFPEGKEDDLPPGPQEPSSAAGPAADRQPSIPAESPLLREWQAEIERQATVSVERAAATALDQMRGQLEEWERERGHAGTTWMSELASKQQQLLEEMRAEGNHNLRAARSLVEDVDRRADGLRAENEAALESISRLAQARLQAEAVQFEAPAGYPRAQDADLDQAVASLHARIESEIGLAKAQWEELLQSSLDRGADRLVKELSARSQEILRDTEQHLDSRVADLRQPLAHISSTAQETLASVKHTLDQEVLRARASLTETEHAVSRMKKDSEQLESASRDALNELHRRLGDILETQTEEMKRRADHLVASVPERLGPPLKKLEEEGAERAIAEVESKIAPRLERVSESLRQLAAREAESEDALRLHRERLRQISESSQREASAQIAATLEKLRDEFESARRESLAKWSEELDAGGARAAHAAAESIGRSSEWFQQEARTRFQVLVEQAAAVAATDLEEKAMDAAKRLETELEARSNIWTSEVHQQFETLAGETAARTRSQFDVAAEAAATSFGQVIRDASEREARQFTERTGSALVERSHQLEHLVADRMQNFEAHAGAAIAQLQARLTSEVEATLASGREAMSADLAKTADRFRTETGAREAAWAESAARISGEAAAVFQERLESAADAWAVSSVRRLNEHGQSAVDALLRSADQTLRDSFARVLEGLSEALRGRPSAGGGGREPHTVGHIPTEHADAPLPPPNEGSSASANA